MTMPAGEGNWIWRVPPAALDRFGDLDSHVKDRIVSNLDELVESGWREPDDFLEPLTGGPFSTLQMGQYRLGCVLDREQAIRELHRIQHRGSRYRRRLALHAEKFRHDDFMTTVP